MRQLAGFLLATLLGAGQETTAPPAEKPAVIEGRVIDSASGSPLRKARVSLELSTTKHDSELVAITDEAGHFRFGAVKPDTYTLQAEKGGFLPGSYGTVKPEEAPTLLKVRDDDHLQGITLRLFQAGAISGHVLDADGDPLPGYEVILWAKRSRRKGVPYSPGDQTTTNHRGEFRFDDLTPGTYYIDAGKESAGMAVKEIPVDSAGKVIRERELWTFYPGALALKDARAIRVESGQEQSGAEITIQRGPLLTVKGRIEGAIGSISKYQVSASVDEGIGWTGESTQLLPDGKFATQLPPGRHTISLMEQTASGLKQVGATVVNLTDQDVSGVEIALAKPAQVRVRAVIEGAEDQPLTNGAASLILEGSEDKGRSTFTQYPPQDGGYLMDNVPAGKYWPWFNNASDLYAKYVQVGTRVTNWQAIDVTEGANLDVLLIYSKKVATLAGDLELPQDELKSPISVLLVSENVGFQENKIIPAQLDQSLHFSLQHMRPGKYLAFASREDDFEVWDNDDFVKLLRSEANEIELHEEENASVHLKLIPKELTDRVRQQLGI